MGGPRLSVGQTSLRPAVYATRSRGLQHATAPPHCTAPASCKRLGCRSGGGATARSTPRSLPCRGPDRGQCPKLSAYCAPCTVPKRLARLSTARAAAHQRQTGLQLLPAVPWAPECHTNSQKPWTPALAANGAAGKPRARTQAGSCCCAPHSLQSCETGACLQGPTQAFLNRCSRSKLSPRLKGCTARPVPSSSLTCCSCGACGSCVPLRAPRGNSGCDDEMVMVHFYRAAQVCRDHLLDWAPTTAPRGKVGGCGMVQSGRCWRTGRERGGGGRG